MEPSTKKAKKQHHAPVELINNQRIEYMLRRDGVMEWLRGEVLWKYNNTPGLYY